MVDSAEQRPLILFTQILTMTTTGFIHHHDTLIKTAS